MKLAKRTVVIGAALMALTAPAVVVTQVVDSTFQSAEAVDWNRPSRLYNNTGSYWIKMYPVPRATNYPTNSSRPNSVFYMDCWVYGQWFAGNYNTNIWFYGYNGSWGYINSSYVYNQISVRRC